MRLTERTEGRDLVPDMNWSKLNSMQLGRYAEYYAKMEFASYGFEVYTSEVDDHGIDFIAKRSGGRYLEIQVKAVRQTNYVFLKKDTWDISDGSNLHLLLLIFEDQKLPNAYLIPAVDWQSPNDLLCDRDYIGQKSKPEYGVRLSKKNTPILNRYRLNTRLQQLPL